MTAALTPAGNVPCPPKQLWDKHLLLTASFRADAVREELKRIAGLSMDFGSSLNHRASRLALGRAAETRRRPRHLHKALDWRKAHDPSARQRSAACETVASRICVGVRVHQARWGNLFSPWRTRRAPPRQHKAPPTNHRRGSPQDIGAAPIFCSRQTKGALPWAAGTMCFIAANLRRRQ